MATAEIDSDGYQKAELQSKRLRIFAAFGFLDSQISKFQSERNHRRNCMKPWSILGCHKQQDDLIAAIIKRV